MSSPDLSKLSPEQLQKLLQGPAAPAPRGFTSNLVNPETQAPLGVGLCVLIMVIMFGFVAARLYSKGVVSKTFGTEDWACILSVILTTAYTGLNLAALTGGGIGPHIWNVRLGAIYNDTFYKELIATQSVYPMALFSVKLSLFLLIRRIFRPNRITQALIWVGIALALLFYFITFVITLAWCAPVPGRSPIASASAGSCQGGVQTTSIVQAGFNVASDVYLLLVPAPVIFDLQMPIKRKLAIMTVFMTGLLASILSVLVLHYRLQVHNQVDVSWGDVPVIITSVWEMNIGIMVGCMPCLPALVKSHNFRHLFSVRAWSRFSNMSKGSKSSGPSGPRKVKSSSFDRIVSASEDTRTLELHTYDGNKSERNKYETGMA